MAYDELSPELALKRAAQEGGGLPPVPPSLFLHGRIKLGELPEITHQFFLAPLNEEDAIPTVTNDCGDPVETLSGLHPARVRDAALQIQATRMAHRFHWTQTTLGLTRQTHQGTQFHQSLVKIGGRIPRGQLSGERPKILLMRGGFDISAQGRDPGQNPFYVPVNDRISLSESDR
jgi:hypothetical protein